MEPSPSKDFLLPQRWQQNQWKNKPVARLTLLALMRTSIRKGNFFQQKKGTAASSLILHFSLPIWSRHNVA